MDKKQMLYKIAEKEMSRMKSLSSVDMRKEVQDWFCDDEIESESDAEVLSDYIEDFMRYREDETEEELQEYLK